MRFLFLNEHSWNIYLHLRKQEIVQRPNTFCHRFIITFLSGAVELGLEMSVKIDVYKNVELPLTEFG